MRRKERRLSPEEAMGVLERGEYGVLALNAEQGFPYAVPLSYVLMNGALYFHSAMDGRKSRALALDRRVCFTVVGAVAPVFDKDFSTYYESAMVFGRATLVRDAEEKLRSLMALAEKYLPEHMDKAEASIRHSFARTAVYRIGIELLSGKSKRPKSPAGPAPA
ncbi:pyridoxamine 5'-phosphate oxidase family protein [Desulfovibrio sp. OttesenSCG-928-A18]|nr:pyridoxamine 5'-phosphate oxidase family protein [Desulfovibrio sp. OttesenSCG-928-A18]